MFLVMLLYSSSCQSVDSRHHHLEVVQRLQHPRFHSLSAYSQYDCKWKPSNRDDQREPV